MKKFKKIPIIFFALILTGIILIYGIIPFIMGFYATRSASSDVKETPEGFEEVSFDTEDNVNLKAWYKAPGNNVTVIVVHGASNSRENVRAHIEMLEKNDFGILAIDVRGHGESEGKTNRFGWQSPKDIKAAVEFIKTKQEKANTNDQQHIAALGLSMGAEVLLASAKDNLKIEAIVAEGATYRSFAEFQSLPKYSGVKGYFSPALVSDLSTRLFSKSKPGPTIKSSIEKSKNTRFLFIAAGDKPEEKDFNEMFNQASQGRGDFWLIENCGHIQGINCQKEEYTKRIVEFLTNL